MNRGDMALGCQHKVVLLLSEQKVYLFLEHWIITKFLTHEDAKLAEILRKLEAQFGNKTLKTIQLYDKYKKTLGRRKAVKNETHQRRSGRSVTEENIHVVRRLIEDDLPLTVSEIATRVSIVVAKFRQGEFLGFSQMNRNKS